MSLSSAVTRLSTPDKQMLTGSRVCLHGLWAFTVRAASTRRVVGFGLQARATDELTAGVSDFLIKKVLAVALWLLPCCMALAVFVICGLSSCRASCACGGVLLA
jgi:hypothetical protein